MILPAFPDNFFCQQRKVIRIRGCINFHENIKAFFMKGKELKMKNDFLKIYPDTVIRADEQYQEPELEDNEAA